MGVMLAAPAIREVKVLEMKKATLWAGGWGQGPLWFLAGSRGKRKGVL